MTADELAKFNGENGQPAYVAVGGIIYDVSASPMWQKGSHTEAHQAGADLTLELKSAPHIAAVVERFPSIGRLEADPEPASANISKLPIIAGAVIILLLLFWFLLR